jgi:hypothetical protein
MVICGQKCPPQYGFIFERMRATGAKVPRPVANSGTIRLFASPTYYGDSIGQMDYDAVHPQKRVCGLSAKYYQLLSLVFSDNERPFVVRFKGKLSSLTSSLVSFSRTPPSRDDKQD